VLSSFIIHNSSLLFDDPQPPAGERRKMGKIGKIGSWEAMEDGKIGSPSG
jgi:hypothetical protein